MPRRPSNAFELRDLERFLEIVDRGGFARAAVSLGITQPVLSRHIAALETALDARLFSREKRHVELTPAGTILAREARTILAQAAFAQRSLRDASAAVGGHLRVGVRTTARFRPVAEAIRAFRARWPSAHVTIHDCEPWLQLEQLRKGTIDVSVLRGPLDLGELLRSRRLRADPIVVAMSANHRLATRHAVRVEDVAAEPFVELPAYLALGYRELARSVFARAGLVPRVVQSAESIDSLLVCVAADIGITFMHDASDELPAPGVVFRALEPEQPLVELHAVWRTDDRNALLLPFIDALSELATR